MSRPRRGLAVPFLGDRQAVKPRLKPVPDMLRHRSQSIIGQAVFQVVPGHARIDVTHEGVDCFTVAGAAPDGSECVTQREEVSAAVDAEAAEQLTERSGDGIVDTLNDGCAALLDKAAMPIPRAAMPRQKEEIVVGIVFGLRTGCHILFDAGERFRP